ncbi:MAG: hypothetical protein FE041_00965 [Thermoplasmata archaeon]|nr:MAG: hypothetical protein FE041_00965 [Thermoplasmata archaeon]
MKIPKMINEAYEQLHKVKNNLAHLYKFLILATPFLTIAFYFVFVFDYLPVELEAKYGALTIAYFIPPAGKESIIPLMLGAQIPPWIVGSTIVIMDVICASIVAYNWWFVEFIINHIPLLSRGYVWLQKKAEGFKRKKLITLSLVIFMIIPFQGSGGISTPIIARLLGVKAKKAVAIVLTGSTITTTLFILSWLGVFNFLK